jgi:hypothetical protein
MTRCGDCGTVTLIRGRYRICLTCNSKTRLARKAAPKQRPQKEDEPLLGDAIPLALVELHHREIGQCPHCLHAECQCDKENE